MNHTISFPPKVPGHRSRSMSWFHQHMIFTQVYANYKCIFIQFYSTLQCKNTYIIRQDYLLWIICSGVLLAHDFGTLHYGSDTPFLMQTPPVTTGEMTAIRGESFRFLRRVFRPRTHRDEVPQSSRRVRILSTIKPQNYWKGVP